MRAVANAGPLIHLSWIDRLDLLPALFDEVLVPLGVQDEVLHAAPDVRGLATLRTAFATDWLRVQTRSDPSAVATLRTELDRGEAEAIVLMQAVEADLLLLDDRRARMIARRHGLPLTGTIGILRMAKDHELLSVVTPLLDELRRHGFRIGMNVVEQVRREETPR